ncbi:hypothetical protein BCR33DRAFT_724194 [Rhizoclosmatium globosum]|uniref:Uncharacterized protein n=1 Tax=Rhizoclosmatium globosum TaxID=329046 RepID=A0A1Y2B823_9FUNG|nr:hypothetical protein BCR33DRAFT_724194 [Rhizoclosmatium globosum]|eukprot:ORY30978.1 hypothetical protein BCR33DRAFT_724194 [Rhizoclosmatium globosum]
MFKSDGTSPLPLPLPPSTEEFNDNQITKEPEIDDSDAVAQPVDPLPELDQPQQPQTQPTQKIHFPQTQSAFKVSQSATLLFIISQKSPNRFSKPASPFKTATKLKSDATETEKRSDSGRKSLGANAFVIPSASKGGGWDIDESEPTGFENGDDDGGVEFMRIVTEGLVS